MSCFSTLSLSLSGENPISVTRELARRQQSLRDSQRSEKWGMVFAHGAAIQRDIAPELSKVLKRSNILAAPRHSFLSTRVPDSFRVCWISSLPGIMTATSSDRIRLIHHCCYLWKTGCTSKPCSCMWPNSTSNSQLMAQSLSQKRTHACTHMHLYWHIQAHAEAWINIWHSVLNENINWQLFSAASICGVSSQFTVSCRH